MQAEAVILRKLRPLGVVYPFFPDDLLRYTRRHFHLLQWSFVRRCTESLLQAVTHLHRIGVLHRDIKPGNILVGGDCPHQHVVLADFGWCRHISPAPMTPGIVTVPYRAPEVELGERMYGFAVDIWSLGITMAELMHGRPFAQHSHVSQKAANSLLAAIDGLVGPLGPETWPGIDELPGWLCRGAAVKLARKGKATCGHPFKPPRREVPAPGQTLLDRMLALRPDHRCSALEALELARTWQQQASSGAPRPVAADSAAPQSCAAASDTPPPPRCEASTQTLHRVRRIRFKRALGPASMFNQAVRQQFRTATGALRNAGPKAATASEQLALRQVHEGPWKTSAEDGTEVIAEQQASSGAPRPVAADSAALSQVVAGQPPHNPKDKTSVMPRELASVAQGPRSCEGSVPSRATQSTASSSPCSLLRTTWSPPLEPLKATLWQEGDGEAARCQCPGFCGTTCRSIAHPRRVKLCSFKPSEGSLFCTYCRCMAPGCARRSAEGGMCRLEEHLWAPYPRALKAVLILKEPLAHMDPVDLQTYLRLAPAVGPDLLLLSLLADVWEPIPVEALIQEFKHLPKKYSANDLGKCFSRVFKLVASRPGAYTDSDVTGKHYSMLCVNGACRHFGLRTLGKRLKLLVDTSSASRPAGRSETVRLGLNEAPLHLTCDQTVLQALIEARTQHGDKLWRQANKAALSHDAAGSLDPIKDWVYGTFIPPEMQWGRLRTAYHGGHVARKVWLSLYHRSDPEDWPLGRDFVCTAFPDVGKHVLKLPWSIAEPQRLRRCFRPIDTTRLAMWTCLLDPIFEVDGFGDAWARGAVTAQTWGAAMEKLQASLGCSPHPVHIAKECLVAIADGSPPPATKPPISQ